MPTTRQQIDAWKARLLDLSPRNRLLYVHSYYTPDQPSLNAPLHLAYPEAADLFDALVRRRVSLPFVFAAPDVVAPPDTLVSPLPAGDLEPALYQLHLAARTSMREQGVNVLFVVVGLLEWFDPIAPERMLRSPLLLLPVELQRDALRNQYALQLLDDEIGVNPVLAHKLRLNYGLSLPDLPGAIADLDMAQLLAGLVDRVAGRKGWQVLPDVALGLFSISRYWLYHDLQYAAEHACEHPLLAGLAGQQSLPPQPALPPPDTLHPSHNFQVLDADAAQQEAIAAARAGASFVLQGPPGTGKSQTIANIVAECLADGKRVLFVSEKMAALQTVHARLRQCGLADFCLELYGEKVGSRSLLDAPDVALEAAAPPETVDFPYDELVALRDQLNDYARVLHTPLGTTGLTAHTVYMRSKHLRDAPDTDAPVGAVDSVTPEQLASIDLLLRQVDTRRDLLHALPDNPWRGCSVTMSSFEERGRIRNYLRTLITTLRELPAVAAAVAVSLDLPPPDGLTATQGLVELADLLREPHATSLWLDMEPSAIQYLQFDIADARQRYTTMAEIETQLRRRYHIGAPPDGTDSADAHAADQSAEDLGTQLRQQRAGPLADLDRDLDGLLERFNGSYTGWTRYLRPGYYRDMRVLRRKLRRGRRLGYRAALADLRLAGAWQAAHRRLEELVPTLAARSGRFFAGRRTDWNAYEASCEWTLRMLALPLPYPLPSGLVHIAGLPPDQREARLAPVHELHARLERLQSDLAEFARLFPHPARLADAFDDLLPRDERRAAADPRVAQERQPQPMEEWSAVGAALRNDDPVEPDAHSSAGKAPAGAVPDQAPQVSPAFLLEHMAELDVWWEFCALRRKADMLGIGAYLDALSQNDPAVAGPRSAFHKRFYQLWLDAACRQWPALRGFQHERHMALVERFCRLDADQLVAAQDRLRHMLAGRRAASSVPDVPGGQVPLREFLRAVAPVLGQFKPCLLMSPLGVSRWLDPAAITFDLVIFDEASQIRTEEAIGAIMRGSALIVAGDPRQLPPGRFFVAGTEGDFDREPGGTAETFESILDATIAAGMPVRTLRRHYRSRHEALISFSNRHLYEGRLITFPAAQASSQLGITFEYVPDGVYDRHGQQPNLPEVQRVADLVCVHMQTFPERTLGVVVLSQVQQWAILRELERRAAADANLVRLFDEAQFEPFFVKQLEHAQGDERDVIIVSVEYARDSRGQVLLNAGLLHQADGERYLNVAVTRAREQVRLVTSLLPEDINLQRVRQPGLLLLREYLEYARHGGPVEPRLPAARRRAREDADQQGDEFPRLEDDLARALAEQGVHVARQIGASALRIDIAVVDAHAPGNYRLGIAGDGSVYRDAATARDRERLHTQVLADRGWRMQRVWSAAWASDTNAELARLLAALSAEEE